MVAGSRAVRNWPSSRGACVRSGWKPLASELLHAGNDRDRSGDFGVLVSPFLLAFVGGWLGGDADPADIRQAVVWGNVPYAVAAVGWIPLALWFKGSLSDPNATIPLAIVPFMLALGVAAVWSVVTQILALAEVQQFSVWRAIASVVILMIPMLLLGML